MKKPVELKIDIDEFDPIGNLNRPDRCPVELAILKLDWTVDAFSGPAGIDVWSTSGAVCRCSVDVRVWAQMRKYDEGRAGGGCRVELTGQVIGEVHVHDWKCADGVTRKIQTVGKILGKSP